MPANPDASHLSRAAGPRRRDLLAIIGGGLAGGIGPFTAQAQPVTPQSIIQGAAGDGQPFDPAAVVEIARTLARRPYAPPPNDLPDALASLTYEQYVSIKALPSVLVWSGENRGFVVQPLHRGFVFSNPVTLFTVEDGLVRRVAYDRSRYDFGKLNVPANVADIGFSGFSLSYNFGEGEPTEFAIVQGATFFRALARGQNFGVVARALTLEARRDARRGDSRCSARSGSSGPRSPPRRSWPRPHRLRIRVGRGPHDHPARRHDHRGHGDDACSRGPTLSMWASAAWDRLICSARTIGATPTTRGPPFTKSTGLQMLNGQGEWLWRPLHNPETLQISAFLDRNPRGFGLLQRDRDYTAFQDDGQHFERRPSLWVEPIGEWDQGAVQLIEIPTDSEVNDNILAYWRPKAADAGRRRGRASPTGSSGAGRRPSARRSPRSRRRASDEDRADAAAVFSSISPAIALASTPIPDLRPALTDESWNRSRASSSGLIRSARHCAWRSSWTPATTTPARCASSWKRRKAP